MRVLQKLDLPNVRGIIERQLAQPYNAISNFQLGKGEPQDDSCGVACETGVVVCHPDLPTEDTVLYWFRANDSGGTPLGWTGLLSNQGGSPGQGAEGSRYYYFKSASPVNWSHTYALTPGGNIRITGYAAVSAGSSFKFAFFNQTLGTDGNPAFMVGSEIILENTNLSGLDPFTDVEVTVPDGANSFALGRGGSTCVFDEIRITHFGTEVPGYCEIVYQDGESVTLENDITGQAVLAMCTVSASNAYLLPTSATDVSEVYIDYLPTDEWTFNPDNSSIIFPTDLITDTYVHARYVYAA